MMSGCQVFFFLSKAISFLDDEVFLCVPALVHRAIMAFSHTGDMATVYAECKTIARLTE